MQSINLMQNSDNFFSLISIAVLIIIVIITVILTILSSFKKRLRESRKKTNRSKKINKLEIGGNVSENSKYFNVLNDIKSKSNKLDCVFNIYQSKISKRKIIYRLILPISSIIATYILFSLVPESIRHSDSPFVLPFGIAYFTLLLNTFIMFFKSFKLEFFYSKKIIEDISEFINENTEDTLFYGGEYISEAKLKSNPAMPRFDIAYFSSGIQYLDKKTNISIDFNQVKAYDVKEVTDQEGRNYTKNAKVKFNGLVMKIKFNKSFESNLYLIPNNSRNSIFSYFEKEKEYRKLSMDNINFNKRFDVYATNPEEARYILDLDFMDFLLSALEKEDNGALWFTDNSLYITLDGLNVDIRDPDIKNTESSKDTIEDIIELLTFVYSYVEKLDIENDIYL